MYIYTHVYVYAYMYIYTYIYTYMGPVEQCLQLTPPID